MFGGGRFSESDVEVARKKKFPRSSFGVTGSTLLSGDSCDGSSLSWLCVPPLWSMEGAEMVLAGAAAVCLGAFGSSLYAAGGGPVWASSIGDLKIPIGGGGSDSVLGLCVAVGVAATGVWFTEEN